MNFDWVDTNNPVAVWWLGLSFCGAMNIALWLILWCCYRVLRSDSDQFPATLMLWLCAAYVFGCAFRSVIPRSDVQRFVLFDVWVSNVTLGRTVATIAEVCFIVQWKIVLDHFSGLTKSEVVIWISRLVVPMIVVAECFSWYAVISTNYLGNTVENSIWAAAFALIGVALIRFTREFRGPGRIALGLAFCGVVIYVAFLLAVDVPMYFNRWQHDLAAGKHLLNLMSGLHDASTRWIVTHNIADWIEEIPWMSLYFSAAVWSSLLLCGFALLRHKAPLIGALPEPTRLKAP